MELVANSDVPEGSRRGGTGQGLAGQILSSVPLDTNSPTPSSCMSVGVPQDLTAGDVID